jgi:hypothetical protein
VLRPAPGDQSDDRDDDGSAGDRAKGGHRVVEGVDPGSERRIERGAHPGDRDVHAHPLLGTHPRPSRVRCRSSRARVAPTPFILPGPPGIPSRLP